MLKKRHQGSQKRQVARAQCRTDQSDSVGSLALPKKRHQNRNGIALFIAMVFILVIMSLVLESLSRVQKNIENSTEMSHVLQSEQLLYDISHSLDVAVQKYEVRDQESLDTMLREAGQIPISVDTMKVMLRLSDADTDKIDINAFFEKGSKNKKKVFHHMSTNLGVSDSYLLYEIIAGHIKEYGVISKASVLEMLFQRYIDATANEEVTNLYEFISVTHSGVVNDKLDGELLQFVEDIRAESSDNTFKNEESVIKEEILKFKCTIAYQRAGVKTHSSFMYTILSKESNTSTPISEVDISF